MCGIAGWVDWDGDLSGEIGILNAMTEKLTSRGPDSRGVWLSPHAALGHRRLVVIDPRGGGQPMSRYKGEHPCVISYNGELYNAPELRRELQSRGHIFMTHNSDTEVLLTSYLEWGTGCLQYLDGIFAFAVWDEKEQRLFMARDRLGVKPLFYVQRGKGLLFASEPKALLAHPLVQPEVDSEGLAEVFLIGPARTPGHGVYRGMKELKPGHYLLYDRRGVETYSYWALQSRPHEENCCETAHRVAELLSEAVRRQLVSDVPVCVLLSGGLDSSALAAFAVGAYRDNGQGPLHTYSVDYLENERYFRAGRFQPDADAPWVERVSRYLGTAHRTVLIDVPELFEALEAAVLARDLPGMADVDSSLYLFCREIKKEATVALSGEAADEVFGGYPWFHNGEDLNAGTFPWIRCLEERLQLLSRELQQVLDAKDYVASRYAETLSAVPQKEGESPVEARRRELFFLNMTWFMNTLLDRKDRMSMACGLEVRVPFCDHRLVEYAWNIPWEIKTCGGRPKGILRRALSGVLPGEVLCRRKSPYPKTHHPAYMAVVTKKLLEILDDRNSPLQPLVDSAALRSLVMRGEGEGQFEVPWFGQLMGRAQLFAYFIQVEAWLRRYGVRLV